MCMSVLNFFQVLVKETDTLMLPIEKHCFFNIEICAVKSFSYTEKKYIPPPSRTNS